MPAEGGGSSVEYLFSHTVYCGYYHTPVFPRRNCGIKANCELRPRNAVQPVSTSPYERRGVPSATVQRLCFEVSCGCRRIKAKDCLEYAVLPVFILQT
jgi:hypothetical protein